MLILNILFIILIIIIIVGVTSGMLFYLSFSFLPFLLMRLLAIQNIREYIRQVDIIICYQLFNQLPRLLLPLVPSKSTPLTSTRQKQETIHMQQSIDRSINQSTNDYYYHFYFYCSRRGHLLT